MRTWRELPDEKTILFSPIGLRPVDDLTGRPPLARVHAVLDAREPDGSWRTTGVRAMVTQGGVIAYPALGRHRSPVGQPPARYRVRVEADHYIPGYRRDEDGIEFDVFPYNDTNPPQSAPGLPQPLVLMPAPDYPFAGHLLVLRGVVVDAGGAPVRDVEVSVGTTRRTLTDARGCFALAMPRPAAPATLQVDAADLRSGRVGGAAVPFPPGLVTSTQIAIL